MNDHMVLKDLGRSPGFLAITMVIVNASIILSREATMVTNVTTGGDGPPKF